MSSYRPSWLLNSLSAMLAVATLAWPRHAPAQTAEPADLPRPLIDVGATRELPQATPKAPASAPTATARPDSPNASSRSAAEPRPTAEASPRPTVDPAADPLATLRKLREWRKQSGAPTPATETPTAVVTPGASTATATDLEAWYKEADEHSKAGERQRAAAMYRKVWESDPNKQFAKSDRAYIQWCSTMVDRDDDALRREAYERITEFEARYPESKETDRYTLVRAMLAADLGKLQEAHRLLETYPRRFPESKLKKQAFAVYQGLAPLPGDRRPTPTPKVTARPSASSAAPAASAPTNPRPTARPTTSDTSSDSTPRPRTTPKPTARPTTSDSSSDATPRPRATTRPSPRPSATPSGRPPASAYDLEKPKTR